MGRGGLYVGERPRPGHRQVGGVLEHLPRQRVRTVKVNKDPPEFLALGACLNCHPVPQRGQALITRRRLEVLMKGCHVIGGLMGRL